MTTGGVTKPYTITANGNVGAYDGATYGYNPFNRLISYTKAGVTTNYWVNALGQRTRKENASGATGFVYGAGNQMLAEYAWNGAGWKSYLWLNGELIGLVRSTTNQVEYAHTDHLGRPELVTDTSKVSIWKGSNTSFNRSVTLDQVGGVNLGFPGQYYDAESTHWNNGFRDYDPTVGRYLQSDPIGLAGGMNTYAYVGGNPVMWTDPLGLQVSVCRDPAWNGTMGPVKHFWVTTSTQSAGMGDPQDGANAGNEYRVPVITPVATVDHSNRPDNGGRECKVVEGADEEKVNDLIKPGRPLGVFIPVLNDCQAFVRSVLEQAGGQFPFGGMQSPRPGHE